MDNKSLRNNVVNIISNLSGAIFAFFFGLFFLFLFAKSCPAEYADI